MKTIRVAEQLHDQLKKLAQIEAKSIKDVTSEAIATHLIGKEFLYKVDLKDVYRFIVLEYINKTKHILKAEAAEKTDSMDFAYLQELQKKFFAAKVSVYENILETLENNKVPKSITEIVDFSTDEDPILMGKISATREIKYELDRLLSAFEL